MKIHCDVRLKIHVWELSKFLNKMYIFTTLNIKIKKSAVVTTKIQIKGAIKMFQIKVIYKVYLFYIILLKKINYFTNFFPRAQPADFGGLKNRDTDAH